MTVVKIILLFVYSSEVQPYLYLTIFPYLVFRRGRPPNSFSMKKRGVIQPRKMGEIWQMTF
jgi:hypothetical protein